MMNILGELNCINYQEEIAKLASSVNLMEKQQKQNILIKIRLFGFKSDFDYLFLYYDACLPRFVSLQNS